MKKKWYSSWERTLLSSCFLGLLFAVFLTCCFQHSQTSGLWTNVLFEELANLFYSKLSFISFNCVFGQGTKDRNEWFPQKVELISHRNLFPFFVLCFFLLLFLRFFSPTTKQMNKFQKLRQKKLRSFFGKAFGFCKCFVLPLAKKFPFRFQEEIITKKTFLFFSLFLFGNVVIFHSQIDQKLH